MGNVLPQLPRPQRSSSSKTEHSRSGSQSARLRVQHGNFDLVCWVFVDARYVMRFWTHERIGRWASSLTGCSAIEYVHDQDATLNLSLLLHDGLGDSFSMHGSRAKLPRTRGHSLLTRICGGTILSWRTVHSLYILHSKGARHADLCALHWPGGQYRVRWIDCSGHVCNFGQRARDFRVAMVRQPRALSRSGDSLTLFPSRRLFIIEGVVTFGVALLGFIMLPDE